MLTLFNKLDLILLGSALICFSAGILFIYLTLHRLREVKELMLRAANLRREYERRLREQGNVH